MSLRWRIRELDDLCLFNCSRNKIPTSIVIKLENKCNSVILLRRPPSCYVYDCLHKNCIPFMIKPVRNFLACDENIIPNAVAVNQNFAALSVILLGFKFSPLQLSVVR